MNFIKTQGALPYEEIGDVRQFPLISRVRESGLQVRAGSFL